MAAPALSSAVTPAVVSIAASNSTSAALMDDGTVWAWGYVYSPYGSVLWPTPHRVDVSHVKQIAVGDDHIVALKSDGTVWAWGSNSDGQLGDGTYSDSTLPVQVKGLTGVRAVAAGKGHSLALKSDGTVWSWGSNFYGQLGDGSMVYKGSAVPVQVKGLDGIKAISSSGSHCLALQVNGVLWAWGENSNGILGDGTNESRNVPVVAKISDIKAFDSGNGMHALAVKDNGDVWAWGDNYRGQLGEGGISPGDQHKDPLEPGVDVYNPDIVRGIPDAVAVAAGGSHSVALKSDGTVWTWGYNGEGQLGLGTADGSDRTSPVQVPGLWNVTAIAAGSYHTLALKDDGTVWAWGSNSDGQVGNSSASSTASPVLVLMSSQIPPPVSPTPVVPTTSPATITTTAAPPGSTNYTLIAAVGILVIIIVAAAAAAYLLFSKKKDNKRQGKKKKGL